MSVVKFPPLIRTCIGIDPSFTRTGIMALRPDKKAFHHHIGKKIGKKDFDTTFHVADELSDEILAYCANFKPYYVIMESPLPTSSMSPALWCLDTLLAKKFGSDLIKTYNPSMLTRIFGKKNHTKPESLALANKYKELMEQDGWLFQTRKMVHDEAEAFIYINWYHLYDPHQKVRKR